MRNSFRLRSFVAALLCVGSAATATAFLSDREHEVKAAYVYNFAKFCDWDSLGDPGAPFLVGVYNGDSYGDVIQTTLAGRSISGHPVAVKHFESIEDLAQCKVVIVGAIKPEQIKHLVNLCRNRGTVLVGDSPDFAKNGGTFGFVLKDRTVRFEVNLQTVNIDRVQVNARLLTLATVVYR